MTEQPKKRRSDAGIPQLTPRDLDVFAWLADMKAISEPDLGVLLGRLAGSDEPVSESAVRRMVVRWRKGDPRNGPWAEARKVMHKEPRIVFLELAGALLVGETQWRGAALSTALHAADVSRVRLWLENPERVGPELDQLTGLQVASWQSERRWRQELAARSPGGRMPPDVHAPDGVLTTPGGKRVAVEVERTPKDGRRLDKIMDALMVPGGYAGVLYVVRGKAVENGVVAAIERARSRGLTLPLDVLPMMGLDS